MKKICFVTGGRMDYGHLYMILKKVQKSKDLELLIIATCMHLSPEFGSTYKRIIKDGFIINKKVECLLSSDSQLATAKSVGLATIGFADALSDLKPDLVVILGDRFELLAAAQACLFMQIPIAHISGGDTTEGAFDESIRHAITKMSHIHFVTNKKSYERVCQMGEDPSFVFNVGSPSVDLIKNTNYLSQNQLEKKLNIKFKKRNILITYHPETLGLKTNENQLSEILSALNNLSKEYCLIFTKSNGDCGGREINESISNFVKERENCYLFDSLGQQVYYSIINYIDCVLGNSSSGITEIPSFGKPTINVGDRQKGRLSCESIINVKPEKKLILDSILKAIAHDYSKTKSPYGTGNACKKIVKNIEDIDLSSLTLQKIFFEY